MIPAVIETFDKLKELHIRKNQDYTGDNQSKFYNFDVAEYIQFQFKNERDKVFANICGIKIGRLAALLSSGKEPNNESILDSFDDLIVYTAIWKADVKRREEEKVKIDDSKNS